MVLSGQAGWGGAGGSGPQLVPPMLCASLSSFSVPFTSISGVAEFGIFTPRWSPRGRLNFGVA